MKKCTKCLKFKDDTQYSLAYTKLHSYPRANCKECDNKLAKIRGYNKKRYQKEKHNKLS